MAGEPSDDKAAQRRALLRAIQREFAAMPVLDDRSDEVLLGYEDPAEEPTPQAAPGSVDPPKFRSG